MAVDLCADEQAPQASTMRIDHSNKDVHKRPAPETQVAFEEVQIKI